MNWALPAFVGSLALFWLSTRQFNFPVRFAVWASGIGLLAFAAFARFSTNDHFGVVEALADAWAYKADFDHAAIAQAFTSNADTVARFVTQLLDFFVVAGVVLAILTLLAFTRGERLEEALRPLILALIGFVAGGAAALALVAVGLGGQIRPQTFIGHVPQSVDGEAQVHDGDTFSLGEVSLRLWGIDAPELSQTCLGAENCGEQSRQHLESLVVGETVLCQQRQSPTGRKIESFGRPLVECWTLHGPQRVNLGERMISDGYAVRYRGDPGYFSSAGPDQFGLGCTLRPDVWRTKREARIAFEAAHSIATNAATMGDCQRRPLTLPSPPDGREGSRQ